MSGCRAGNYEVAKVLFTAKADIKAKDKFGSALDFTRSGKNLPAILQLFPIEQGPAKDKDAWYNRMKNIIQDCQTIKLETQGIKLDRAVSLPSALLAAKVSINYATQGHLSLLDLAKEEIAPI